MLSRVANHLFWLNRYMERGYGQLTLIKTNYSSTIDSGDYLSWNSILETYTGKNGTDLHLNLKDAVNTIQNMLFNHNYENALVHLVTRARENGRSTQEHISKEVWLTLNQYYLFVTDKNRIKQLNDGGDPIFFIDQLIHHHLLYYGNTDITQERGNAYCFMNLGKYLERIFQILDFLNVRVLNLTTGKNLLEDSVFWKSLLFSIGGFQLYLKTYKSIFKMENVIEMVVLNKFFPHSVYFSIKKLSDHIHSLNTFNDLKDNRLSFLIGKLESNIKYSNIESIKKQGVNHFIQALKNDVIEISESINTTYFSHFN